MILQRVLLRSAAAVAVAVVAFSGTMARAQFGPYYPGGYGGWGGWGGGGTVAGDTARGLGAFAAGAGQYNIDTAQAASINTDTVMKWNNYVWANSVAATQRERAKLVRNQANTEEARQQILARLRDNPEPRDIYNGNALNVAREEINNPNIYARTLKSSKVKVGGQTIRNIPFQAASAGIITSIHDLIANGPPDILKEERFAPDRAAMKEVGAEVRKDLEEGNTPDPEDLKKIRALVKAARTKLEAEVPKTTRGYDAAEKYLKSVAGLTRMLEGPSLPALLQGAEKHPNATLGELLEFMNAYNLRFGPAQTPEQRRIYDSLYAQLSAVRKEVSPGRATPPTTVDHAHAAEFFGKMQPKDVEEVPPPPPPPATPGAK